ncbi:TlpA disulfide reductase family protein [Pedobacter ginsengisoli]|uniref:TlpA disulfide reductase family protein n=1 Tax=Pedobacter ginsengisoli TaxID=363852 RepID=UPI002550343D|nr:TlpA disulfide reductase family protein [Pedobacter ginsengisoli]
MKNYLTILLIILGFGLSIRVKAQKNDGFTLNGQLKGLPDGAKVYLTTQEEDTVARTFSKGDRFTFTGRLALDGRFHFIRVDTLVSNLSTKAIFLENRPITVSGTIGNRKVIVRGSPGHEKYKELMDQASVYKKAAMENRVEKGFAFQMQKAGLEGDSITIIALKKRQDDRLKKMYALNDDMEHKKQALISNNPASLYTPYVILNMINGYEEQRLAYKQLTHSAQASYYGVELKNTLDNGGESGAIRENGKIPNFNIISPEGKQIQILDIASKSKFTLIDCWASWCSPCRAEIPRLKELYTLYNPKGLNIVGISLDKKTSDWKKALHEDATIWDHGIENKEGLTVNKLFDLKAIPAYILIDNKGKLIAFDCARSSVPTFGGSLRGEALHKKIAELLSEAKSN